MAKNLNNLIFTTRNSVLVQLKSSNALFDVVNELTNAAQSLPPEQVELQKLLATEALKVYEQATLISDKAAVIGKNLAELVGE